MKLIMLCGQGSSGKSYFASQLKNNLKGSICLVRMDDIVIETGEYNLIEYINRIQDGLDGNFDYVIMDLAQDSALVRTGILDMLNLKGKEIDFITFSLRPDIDVIIERQRKRQHPRELLPEVEEKLRRIYTFFEYPTDEEFEKYNFNSVSHFIRSE